MLYPRIMKNDLWNDWMNDFSGADGFWGNTAKSDVMKTDVRETEESYIVEMDLPGFKKDEVQATLEEGYLTISASKNTTDEKKDDEGRYIRRERFYGNCSRRFYVGESITEEDISAKFEDGILCLSIPKKSPGKVEKKTYIQIEG